MSTLLLADLRARAKARGLAISGTKADLLRRLLQNDPLEMERNISGELIVEGDTMRETADIDAGANVQISTAAFDDDDGDSRRVLMEREVRILERKKQLMQRELDLTRRELETLQRGVAATARRSMGTPETQTTIVNATNVKMISDLISVFDGSVERYTVWEKQLKFIKQSHDLSDDLAKILIGMKLRGKAQEWLHSRTEHLSMSFGELLGEIRRMYSATHSRVDVRKKFEERKWNKSETFREYAHEKIVLGNRVPMSEEDTLDYLIEGIADRSFCNQARMQSFTTKDNCIRKNNTD